MILLYHRWCTSFNRERNILNISQSTNWQSREAFAKRKGFGRRSYPFNDPAHRKIDYTKFNCKVANSLADATISFWTHPTYTLAHIEADVKAFKKVAAAMMK